MSSRAPQYALTVATLLGVATTAPLRAYAQPEDFKGLANAIIDILSLAFPLLIGLILLAFLWGLTKFVFSLGGADSTAEGKTIMFWGIVALFVVLSVWGLVGILTNTFL